MRANESARPVPLIQDRWAAVLAGEEGMAWVAQWPVGELQIVLRTRYFDDFLRRVTTSAKVRQVVLLAAGYDTRAFRLDWPVGTRLFEIDRGSVLRHKAAVLDRHGAAPRCAYHVIAADLTEPWAGPLLAAGFDPAQPSVWLLEGFLYYLANADGEQLLRELGALAGPGSHLGFDAMNPLMLTSPFTRSWMEMQQQAGAPWIGTMEDPAALLADLGWAAYLTQAGLPDANHGRWPYPVVSPLLPFVPHNWFVTAARL